MPLPLIIHQTLRKDGTEALRIACFCPSFDDAPQIEDYYRTLCEEALHFCREELLSSLLAPQEELTLQQKMRLLPPSYTLRFTCTERRDNLLCIRMDASLSQFGTPTKSTTDAHVWLLPEQLLLPPPLAAKILFGKRIPCDALLLQNSDCLLLRNGRWQRYAKKRKKAKKIRRTG